MKKLLSLTLILALSAGIRAQYNISGRVVSTTDGTPLEMTTVRLFTYTGSDSTMVQGAQTDTEGSFLLSNISNGDYRIFVSNVGYREQNAAVRINNSDVKLKSFRLKEDVQALAEVQVQGHAAEMTVKGDTIEYNTAAYKVSENAMVEELLKKMNGVSVDKEGNVTVNGETITAVRVDGKKFFGNDVQSATKNIPADMIDKIQVIDEKSEMAKLTGFDDDEGEHIISEAKDSAKAEYDKIITRAQSDADRMKEEAKAQIETDTENARKAAREEIASLAMQAAEKVVGTNVSADTDSAIFDEFLKESSDE